MSSTFDCELQDRPSDTSDPVIETAAERVLEADNEYRNRGWQPIPLIAGTKRPICEGFVEP